MEGSRPKNDHIHHFVYSLKMVIARYPITQYLNIQFICGQGKQEDDGTTCIYTINKIYKTEQITSIIQKN